MEIREYTRDEFNKFIEQNNLESFNSNQVDAFSHDVVEKSKKGELDEFETYCAAAEYVMLEKAIVVENDLTKSLVYYRPTQVETVEIPDGIFKSINDKSSLRYKETSLNILKGIAGICCVDKDAIEKAKALPIGTEKTYGGKVYVKTERGWRPKRKSNDGNKESKTENDDKKSREIASLKEELDHHRNELDNLEKKKDYYYSQYAFTLYHDRHKKIEENIKKTEEELDKLMGKKKNEAKVAKKEAKIKAETEIDNRK